MKLNNIFRKMLEENGIEYLLSHQSTFYLADLYPSLPSVLKYIWKSMVKDGIIQNCINTNGSDAVVHKLSYKYAMRTGFEYGKVLELLNALSLGMRQSFWGIKVYNESLSLVQQFTRHKKQWSERLSLHKKGVLRIQLNGKYGFITSDGECLIEPQYSKAYLFDEGLAKVHDFKGNQYYINILGNIELEIKIEDIYRNHFSEIGFIQRKLLTYSYILTYSYNGDYGLINSDGKITPPIYQYINMDCHSIIAAKAGNLGLINNKDFTELTPFDYSKIAPFANNRQRYTIATLRNGRYMLLDRDGRAFEVENEYDPIERFYIIDNLVFLFSKQGRLTVVNDNLKKFDYSRGFIMDDRIRSISPRTTVDTPNSPILYFRDAYDRRTIGNSYVYIKNDGQVLNDISFTMAHQFNNGIAWVKKGSKWYRINTNGEYLFTLCGFDVLTPEYKHSVLARDLRTGLLVLLSHIGEVLFTFPASQDLEIEMDKGYHYIISANDTDYVWYNGVLTEVKGKIIRRNMLYSNYVWTKLEDRKFGLYDLEDGQFHIFKLRAENDYINHLPRFKKISRGLLCCKTSEKKVYIVNVYNNKFSDLFDEFPMLPISRSYLIGRKNGRDFLLDKDLNIVSQYDEIV